MESLWVSDAMRDPRQLRPFTNDLVDPATGNLSVDTHIRNSTGEALGPEAFPSVIWGAADRGARTFGKLPDLVFGFGYWVVSARCATLVRRFDLGNGGLYPVDLLQRDRMTPIGSGQWFCLNFGNRKRSLRLDSSIGLGRASSGQWLMPMILHDGDIALSPNALDGPDIWIDPDVDQAIFLSGPLGSALQRERCASGWRLTSCRLATE